MKIYTKTGDDGTTGLYGGGRVSKGDPIVEAYGTVDELNAAVGMARATGLDPFTDGVLERVQTDLFTIGAEVACVPGEEHKLKMALMGLMGGRKVPDVVKLHYYRYDLFGKHLGAMFQQAMRGDSELSIFDREIIAAFVSKLNQCVF